MEKIRRIKEAKKETLRLLSKWETRKTFDSFQEEEKRQRICEYRSHLSKLDAMLVNFC